MLDPGPGIRKKHIPDPWCKKHQIPDPDPQHWGIKYREEEMSYSKEIIVKMLS
jgi:hypothetical protein